jgi:hypothetical protein
MAQQIQLKRTSVTNKVPTTSNLETGEIAINTTDGKLYVKKTIAGVSSVVEVGSTTFNGDVTGNGNESVTLTLSPTGVNPGTYTKITVDAKGRATFGTTLSASDVPSIDWSKITGRPTTLAGYGIVDGQSELEYTPVQQGGGAGQVNNKLYIGWTGTSLGLQVDSVNYGSTWPITTTTGATINPTTPKNGDIRVSGSTISIYASGAWRQIYPAVYS